MALLLTVIAGTAAIVASTEFLRRYLPAFYFPMAEIIRGINPTVGWSALVLRFALPLVAGVVVGAAMVSQSAAAGGGAGFMAAAFLVWPPLLRPQSVDPIYRSHLRELQIVYAMFIGSYTLMGLAGGQLGGYLRQVLAPLVEHASTSGITNVARDELGGLTRGVISGAVGSALLVSLTSLVRRRSQK